MTFYEEKSPAGLEPALHMEQRVTPYANLGLEASALPLSYSDSKTNVIRIITIVNPPQTLQAVLFELLLKKLKWHFEYLSSDSQQFLLEFQPARTLQTKH